MRTAPVISRKTSEAQPNSTEHAPEVFSHTLAVNYFPTEAGVDKFLRRFVLEQKFA